MNKLKFMLFLSGIKLYIQNIFIKLVDWKHINQSCIKLFIFLSMICFVADYYKNHYLRLALVFLCTRKKITIIVIYQLVSDNAKLFTVWDVD